MIVSMVVGYNKSTMKNIIIDTTTYLLVRFMFLFISVTNFIGGRGERGLYS